MMKKFWLFFIIFSALVISGCGNDDQNNQQEDESGPFNYNAFSNRFDETALPYELPDTTLLNNTDTSYIRNINFAALIPDSVKSKLLGTTENIKYVPLVKAGAEGREKYYILKAVNKNKKTALLVTFDKDGNYGAAMPFLIPDNDQKSSQISSIDKSYNVYRAVIRNIDGTLKEGKDVYAYNKDAKQFTLIMTDILDDSDLEVINPIDTFSREHRYAADYVKDKRNFVSVRDGQSENEINFFVHFEKNNGECIGELKGTAFFTTTKTAVFSQAGNPCVLELNFSASSVSLREVEGCGTYRDVRCVFEGSYPKKKQAKPKTNG